MTQTTIQPHTRQWKALVESVKASHSTLQWVIGDALLKIAPLTGELNDSVENILRQFIVETDVPYTWRSAATMRITAHAYPPNTRNLKASYSAHYIMYTHPDRHKLIKTIKLTSEAEKIIREYRENNPDRESSNRPSQSGYTVAEKIKVAKEYKKGNTTQYKLADKYGVSQATVRDWITLAEKPKSTGRAPVKADRWLCKSGFKVSPELYEWFSADCVRRGITESQWLRDAISEAKRKDV